jgi:topoisomerase IA-like protein
MNKIILRPGLELLLQKDPQVLAGTLRKAEEVAQEARAIAPVATGRYQDSIRALIEDGKAIVLADVPYAVYVEYGTVDTPTFAPLRRAMDMAAE